MPLSPEITISQVKTLVESDKRNEIRLNANGGNSILVVCPPDEEHAFVRAISDLMDKSTYDIIDLNASLVAFLDEFGENVAFSLELLQGSPHQVFKMPEGESGTDFFKYILDAIRRVYSSGKIPVLVHTGVLYGTGIDNIHFMEHEVVMKSDKPLIILYPASHDGEKLLFLDSRPASKYRCMIAN